MIDPEVRTKVLRLVALIRFFESGGEIAAQELADMGAMPLRTAQRLIVDVQWFVPVYESKRGRYRRVR